MKFYYFLINLDSDVWNNEMNMNTLLERMKYDEGSTKEEINEEQVKTKKNKKKKRKNKR